MIPGFFRAIIPAGFFILFAAAGAGFAQEFPCVTQNRQIKIVRATDRTATAECRNRRAGNSKTRRNRGIDNITIAGHVTHQNGVRMVGVTMRLENLSTGAIRTVTTDEVGTYFFNNLQFADDYELKPAKEGYEFYPPSVIIEGLVYDEVFNFIAAGPPPNPPPPPANQPPLAWTSYYDNPLPPGSMSEPNADFNAMMARDAQGSVYVAGTSYTENYEQTGNTDISLYKTDANGNRVWARTFDGDWYIWQSRTNSLKVQHWGESGDTPVPADYDGDKRTDFAVFRGSVWYILKSSDNQYYAVQWGLASDKPVQAAFAQ